MSSSREPGSYLGLNCLRYLYQQLVRALTGSRSGSDAPTSGEREILDGAVLAFGKNGYKRATLADVAEHAGVCAGTVSHYFGSKARLFEKVIAERLMPFVEAEEASLASHQGPMCAIGWSSCSAGCGTGRGSRASSSSCAW